MPILKIFAAEEEQDSILEKARLVEKYEAFVVVEATSAVARKLESKFALEDITEQYQVAIGGRNVDPLAPAKAGSRSKRASKTVSATTPPDSRPHHYIVQFIGPVKRSWLTGVGRAGGTLRQPYGGFAYVVRANGKGLAKIRALKYVRWVGHLPHADRVARMLREGDKAEHPLAPRRRVAPGVLSVQVFGAEDVTRVAREAKKLGFKVLDQERPALLLLLQGSEKTTTQQKQVRALSAVHGVRRIRERAVKRPSNNVATGLMGNAYAVVKAGGLKLAGEGEIIAVCDTGLDTGDPDTIHPDFAGRVLAIKSYPITPDFNPFVTNPGANDGAADLDSGHGTHVAGSVVGDGSASASLVDPIRGHAHKARLVFQAIEQEMKWKPSAPARMRRDRYLLAGIPANMAPLFQFAYDQGARIHSNSWGGGNPGSYDEQCGQFDAFVWRRRDFCIVVAAGNDGSDADADGRINPGSVSSPGTAKNCVTVGACENLRPEFNSERYGGPNWWPGDYPVAPYKADPIANNPNQIVPFSSRGPTIDGRVKPEVVAPGTYILSTRSSQLAPNNFAWAPYPANKREYFHMGGTSMATPLTAGALALLREFLRTKRKIASPSAALLKALLIAGAKRLPSAAPAGALLDNEQGFGAVNLDRSVQQVVATVEGPGLQTGQLASGTLKVGATGKTLRIVLAYSDFPGATLVNNLNLIVTDPAGRQYTGNQPVGATRLSMDTRNNVEVVQVNKAKKGTWTYRVVASNILQGPQDFALAGVLI